MARATGSNVPLDPGKPLVRIFPLWAVIAIAIVALAATAALLVWALLCPSRFDGIFSRFILSLGLSLGTGFFLFVVYPWGFRLTKIPGLDVSVEIVGPAALILILLFVLLRHMPVPEAGRLHLLVDRDGNRIEYADIGTVTIESMDGLPQKCWMVADENRHSLMGVYVWYPDNRRTIKFKIKPARVVKAEEIVFSRDNPEPIRLMLEKE